jgi:hypothetical protein
MVTQERIWEASMASGKANGQAEGTWMVWALWAAGASLLLVELNAGMAYVESALQKNMANLMGWLPAAGTITLRVAENSLWHWGMLQGVMQAVPLGVLGLLLVTVGLVLRKSA